MTEFIITSTTIIFIVLILRAALRNHVSHCCIYALWLMVVLRLAIPVTFIRSPLSVLNYINGENLTVLSDTSSVPESGSGNTLTDADIPEQPEPVFDMPGNNFAPAAYNPANEEKNAPENIPAVTKRAFPFKTFLLSVWILGCVILGSFFMTVNFQFHHKLIKSRRLLEQYTTEKINVYLVEDLNSPCIFGLFRPAVYLNAKALENPESTEYVLAHELCHLRHGDLFWSFVRCLFTVVYWFHPLVWCAAILSKRDCEYACDESVLLQYERASSAEKEFHAIRAEYGSTLLSLIPQNTFSSFGIASTSMTSRKKLLRQRICYIAQKPETRLAAVIVLIAASLLAIGCTLTSSDNNGSTVTDEMPTGPISENHTSDGDFPEMAKHPGDVIYTALFSGKTLQIVMTEAHYHALPENTNHLSGEFAIRLFDENMNLISETPLFSGGFVSELGTHIDVTPEQLEKTFEANADKFIYRIPYSENEETLYAASVYSIKEDGSITRLLPDETVPDELRSPDPDFIATDNHFQSVPNIWIEADKSFNTNFWENYVTIQNTTHLSFYTFNDENSTISLIEDYSGRGEGADIDAAMKKFTIRRLFAFPDDFATTDEPLVVLEERTTSLDKPKGYCPIDPALAVDENSLTGYITDAYVDIALSGYNSDREIYNALFSDTTTLNPYPRYKMIDGTLCGNSSYYAGVPESGTCPVAVSVDDTRSIIYYLTSGIDSRVPTKIEVIKCDDGKWRIGSNPEFPPLVPLSAYGTPHLYP